MMSTNLYSSFLVALAVAATAAVTGCAVGEAADDANAPELSLQSTSLPCNEVTPPEYDEEPSSYASGQRSWEDQSQRAGGEERCSSSCLCNGCSQGSKVRSQIGDGAPQGSCGQPQQGQYAQPRQGQYEQPQQGQCAQPRQGQDEQPQQGQCAQPRQGQDEQPQQGQYEGYPDGMQGGEFAGAYDDPVVGGGPVPCYQPVTYPVFVPVFVGCALPMWGSLYGLGCYL
jgi:hypothetical protein